MLGEYLMARVILDASHGGNDLGVISGSRFEKDDNLNLALAVGDILTNNNINVVYTRFGDYYISPITRTEIANRESGDLLVTIHRGSSPAPNTNTGARAFIYEQEGINVAAANNILMGLEEIGLSNVGISFRDVYILRNSNMPALEIVVGYIENDYDNAIFDNRFDEIAAIIADGIIEALEVYGIR